MLCIDWKVDKFLLTKFVCVCHCADGRWGRSEIKKEFTKRGCGSKEHNMCRVVVE